MPKYFNYFPNVYYNFDNSNNYDVVTNILSKVTFEKDFVNNASVYYNYVVADGETPDIVAHKVYGSTERHWIILAFNNIVNPYLGWPMEQRSLELFIDKKYQDAKYANNTTSGAGTSWAKTNVYNYYKVETQTDPTTSIKYVKKIELDANTYANVSISTTNYTLDSGDVVNITISKETRTYYDYEIEKNDSKRNIKLLKPEFINAVENEFKKNIA